MTVTVCGPNFSAEENELALKLYGGLSQQGVSCQQIDANQDGDVASLEVFDYALRRFETYRGLLQGIEPRLEKFYFERGMGWLVQADLKKARGDFTKAIQINPKYALAYERRGSTWLFEKHYDKAIVEFKKAIELDPQIPSFYFGLATAFADQKNFDGAIAYYNKVIELSPDEPEAYVNLGLVHMEKDELRLAIKFFAQAITRYPMGIKKLLEMTPDTGQDTWTLSPLSARFQKSVEADLEEIRVAKLEWWFVVVYSAWEAKEYKEAKRIFDFVCKNLQFRRTPSEATREYFKSLLQLMPSGMQQDEDVKTNFNFLRGKLNQR